MMTNHRILNPFYIQLTLQLPCYVVGSVLYAIVVGVQETLSSEINRVFYHITRSSSGHDRGYYTIAL